MASIIPIKETYHYYHKGVSSRSAWAYDDARKTIATKWANFLKAMPDTSNVTVQDITIKNLGGKTARMGLWTGELTITGAGSKTKGKTLTQDRSWEVWFDVHYEMQLVSIPVENEKQVSKGLSIEEVNRRIAAAGVS